MRALGARRDAPGDAAASERDARATHPFCSSWVAWRTSVLVKDPAAKGVAWKARAAALGAPAPCCSAPPAWRPAGASSSRLAAAPSLRARASGAATQHAHSQRGDDRRQARERAQPRAAAHLATLHATPATRCILHGGRARRTESTAARARFGSRRARHVIGWNRSSRAPPPPPRVAPTGGAAVQGGGVRARAPAPQLCGEGGCGRGAPACSPAPPPCAPLRNAGQRARRRRAARGRAARAGAAGAEPAREPAHARLGPRASRASAALRHSRAAPFARALAAPPALAHARRRGAHGAHARRGARARRRGAVVRRLLVRRSGAGGAGETARGAGAGAAQPRPAAG